MKSSAKLSLVIVAYLAFAFAVTGRAQVHAQQRKASASMDDLFKKIGLSEQSARSNAPNFLLRDLNVGTASFGTW